MQIKKIVQLARSKGKQHLQAKIQGSYKKHLPKSLEVLQQQVAYHQVLIVSFEVLKVKINNTMQEKY